jgi:hypothetical protein
VTRWAVSTFNDELDVLEIRLETLDSVVDRFVLTEATVTQRNQPKPLYFDENKERFAKWLPKIDHVIVEDMPGGEGVEADWVRERFQRSASERALTGNLDAGDMVLVSDLDEIPYAHVLEECWDLPPCRICMDMFVYRLNWRWLDRGCPIGSTASVHPASAFNGTRTVHDVLVSGWSENYASGAVAGWHLAYQGDIGRIRRKMTCIADRFYEQLVPDEKKGDPDVFLTDGWIQESIDTGRDIYGRDYRPSEWVGVEEMPPCVQADPERYVHMMVPEPEGGPIGIRCTCGAYYNDAKVLCHFPKCELFEEPGVAV